MQPAFCEYCIMVLYLLHFRWKKKIRYKRLTVEGSQASCYHISKLPSPSIENKKKSYANTIIPLLSSSVPPSKCMTANKDFKKCKVAT